MAMGLNSQQSVRAVAFVAWVVASGGTVSAVAAAAPCPGNPEAIGVSRILTVSPNDYSRLGLMQYHHSLPLNDREVVLTFDDGPIPPYSDRVLQILAHDCVKATFFLVGRQVAANPDAARRVLAAGHTIGNHSQNHVLHFDAISEARAEQEVQNGYRTISAAVGDGNVAPFFRVPGLGRTAQVEKFARSRSLIVWSADTVADDWTPISSGQVLRRALSRLEARGKGILLLHDIQPRTVLMLPSLLAELKRRHFRIVHVVPDRAGAPPPAPVEVSTQAPDHLGWPRIVPANGETAGVVTRIAGSETAPVEHAVSDAQAADPVPIPPRRKLRFTLSRRHKAVAAMATVPTYFRPDTY
jgi:peptidoglycan/xylan/chitin deacetylase (PgdA/CDA1 family)